MKPKLTTRILKYLLITSAVIAVAYGLIWIALQGYSLSWTGFGDFTQPSDRFERGKTFWDWMELLIIPLALAGGVFFLNRSEQNIEREIATDRQQESALQSYLDRMADLLLKENLRTSDNEEVRNVARIRTLTVLRGLDSTRKGLVLLFLHEANLLNKGKPIVSLAGANLSKADLLRANLSGADLSNVNLSEANLFASNLSEANLLHADLSGAKLCFVNLVNANLETANLERTDLYHSNLINANLHFAKLKDASFKYTNLELVNLNETIITKEQLARAFSLKGATMPDGTIHK